MFDGGTWIETEVTEEQVNGCYGANIVEALWVQAEKLIVNHFAWIIFRVINRGYLYTKKP